MDFPTAEHSNCVLFEKPKKGTLNLNLGSGNQIISGYVGVDMVAAKNVDVVAPIEKLPFKNDCVDNVRIQNVLEHVADLHVCLKEIWRVCKNGAFVRISVPHWSGWLSNYEEHVRRFNLYSFMDYTVTPRMTPRHAPVAFDVVHRHIAWDKHGFFFYRHAFEWFFNLHPLLQTLYEQTFLAYLFPSIELHFQLRVKK